MLGGLTIGTETGGRVKMMTKLQPIWILLAAAVGLLLGRWTPWGEDLASFIEPFLMVLLFFVFLSADGRKMRNALKNRRFTSLALAVNFIWTPFLAMVLGHLFFGGSTDLQMGLVMLLVTPCTDWYLIFTELAGGNVELGASILPLNLLLQILLLPVYLLLFFGSSVQLNAGGLLLNMLLVLVMPLCLAFLCKSWIFEKRRAGVNRLMQWGDGAQLIFLCLAVLCMFASEGQAVFAHPGLLGRMFVPLLLFFLINVFLVQKIGKVARMNRKDTTALQFTTLARNSPLSLAIAVASFPDRPLISLALVIGPLIELPVLAMVAWKIRKTI